MSVYVKICGMTSSVDAVAVSELEPDAVGFVFWPNSKRYVDPAEVGDWDTAKGVARVGVFVNAAPGLVRNAVKSARLDIVQLHGDEDPDEYIEVDAQLWKVLHINDAPRNAPNSAAVAAFLVDSRTAEMPGGTGVCCDWNAASDFVKRSKKPVLLAGGLDPDNVADALESVRPWGVDVSTGVERAPGEKDLKLVEEFIARCRKIR